jgi:hypothetical protein
MSESKAEGRVSCENSPFAFRVLEDPVFGYRITAPTAGLGDPLELSPSFPYPSAVAAVRACSPTDVSFVADSLLGH